jgi:phosphoglucosamine mutase
MSERVLLGGTDGFRGEATMEPGAGLVNPETFAGATFALIEYQRQHGVSGPLVTARDTRPSSEALHTAVNAAGLAAGVEVISLDVVPTPAAQLIARELGAMATVVVTASHNPYEDNGWKGMLGISKPDKTAVQAISDGYWDLIDANWAIPLDRKEGITHQPDMIAWYSSEVVKDIESEFGKQPLANKLFVVDGAFGAAQQFTPDVLRRLGAEVEEFSCDGSGLINDGCGAANLNGVKNFLASERGLEIVRDPRFVGAIANDGDADRMLGVGASIDADGSLHIVELTGNHVMEALAEGQSGFVGTLYTNTASVRRIKNFEECPNGDMYVTQALLKKQAEGEPWMRGGEFSGHYVVLDWLTSGDGVRSAAWYAAYVATKGKTFADIYTELPMWAEVMDKVKFSNEVKDTIMGNSEVQLAIAKAEAALGNTGRIVVRASGTEPLVRVWGEAEDEALIKRVVAELMDVVRSKAAA